MFKVLKSTLRLMFISSVFFAFCICFETAFADDFGL